MQRIQKVIQTGKNTCIKIAGIEEANGYLYFLEHCPTVLKEHIPKLFSHVQIDDKIHLTMEWKADTVPIGKMLTYDLLTDHVFDSILNLLETIHGSIKLDNYDYRVNLLDNYYPKFISRFNTFPVYEKLSINLLVIEEFFQSYTPLYRGCIHGDYWFSNLLWCETENKLYMIDMRGRQGEIYSICGDALYDYGKLMQSIVGFDVLIQTGKRIDKDKSFRLQDKMITRFNLSVDNVLCIKKICAVLMLGSIPFHSELLDNLHVLKEIVDELFPGVIR